jgi:antitoxin component HigA of HigAB toxin-antitoxin module
MKITTDAQHAVALARCETLIRRKRPSAAELAELDALSADVAAYEEKRWPISGGFALKPLSDA